MASISDIVSGVKGLYDIFQPFVGPATQFYNWYQTQNNAEDMAQFVNSPLVDPFGPMRPHFQNMLMDIYEDPTNMDSWAFLNPMHSAITKDIMEKVDARAAAGGKYWSTDRLMKSMPEALAPHMGKTYTDALDIATRGAGINIAPNANVALDAMTTSDKMDAAEGKALLDLIGGLGGALQGFDLAALEQLANEFGIPVDEIKELLGLESAADTGQEYRELFDAATDMADNEAMADIGIQPDTGLGFEGFDALGDPLFDPGEATFAAGAGDIFATDSDVGSIVAGGDPMVDAFESGNLGGNLSAGYTLDDAGMYFDVDDVGGLDFGGAGDFFQTDILSDQWDQMVNEFSGLDTVSSLGGVVGGWIGKELGSMIPGIGTDSPIGGIIGGSIGSGAGASLLGGPFMAAAGPAALAGSLLTIGSGIYDVLSNESAKDAAEDAWRAGFVDFIGGDLGNLTTDPSGLGLGEGWLTNYNGVDMWLPMDAYSSLYQKLTQGEYGKTGPGGGQFALVQDPETGEWIQGAMSASIDGGPESWGATWRPLGEGYQTAALMEQWDAINRMTWEREKLHQVGGDIKQAYPTYRDSYQARADIVGLEGGLESGYNIWGDPVSGFGTVGGGTLTGGGGNWTTSDKWTQPNPDDPRTYQSSDPAYLVEGTTANRLWQRDLQRSENTSCFVGETLVLTPDGLKRIDRIEEGDAVMTPRGKATVREIEIPDLGDRDLYDLNNIALKGWFTAEHPFYTDRGWVSISPEATKYEQGDHKYKEAFGIDGVSTLRPGDNMHLFSDRTQRLESIKRYSERAKTKVYNLLLSSDHRYFAGPDPEHLFLVHNKD